MLFPGDAGAVLLSRLMDMDNAIDVLAALTGRIESHRHNLAHYACRSMVDPRRIDLFTISD